MGNNMARILIVDDSPSQLLGIQRIVEKLGHQILTATDGAAGVETAKAELPDLVLMDVVMPNLNGFQATRTLARDEATRHIPVILVTTKDQDTDRMWGMRQGAKAYITKPFSPKELMARIKAVLRRRAPQLTDDVIDVGGLKLDPVTHRLSGNSQSLQIGPTEFRLLHFFMTHPERVFSRSQLLDQVWGDHVFVEERTVDVHIRRLRKALEPSGHDAHVETVRGSGYRFTAQVPAR